MPNDFDRLDRAKQFKPFDALKGFREALAQKERTIDNRVDVLEEKAYDINKILTSLKINDVVEITYYKDLKYVTKRIKIEKISLQIGKIFLNNQIFYFDDIKDIKRIN